MNRGIGKRITAVITSLAVVSTGLTGWVPGQRVQAAEQAKKTISLGISQIGNPSRQENGTTWEGDYVYYGYQNKPIKWRVLDTTGKAGISSAAGGILLQSDQILATMPYQNETGDVLDTWLKNFENNYFSAKEKDRVMKTTRDAGISLDRSLESVGLQGDTMFLLDVVDLATNRYGYIYQNGGVVNSGIEGSWWLRSTYPKLQGMVGCVLSDMVFRDAVFEDHGVVPAFNLDPSKVLLVTAADEKKDTLKAVRTTDTKTWRLTLSEGDTLEAEETTRDEDDISVPYTYMGTSASQISVMITDGDYQEDGTEIKYYGKVSEGNTVSQDDEVTFTLPEGFDEESDSVYLLAEQVNGANRTDYASEPVELEIPPFHEHDWGGPWYWDEDGHWQRCTAPGCDLTEEDYQEDYEDLESYEEHDFGDNEGVVIKEATPEEDGIEVIRCDICGQNIEQSFSYEDPDDDGEYEGDGEEDDDDDEDDEEEEHEWAEIIVKAATCTETGTKRYYCLDEDCDEYYDATIPALSASLSHTFGDWVQETAPTEEQEGVSRRTCSVCGASETKTVAKLVHKHDYNVLMSDENYHWFLCACGETEDLEPHKWNKGKVLIKPTKDLEGEIQYRCTVCDVTVNRTMAKIGTKFSKGIYRYRVTAGKNGSPSATLLGFVKGKWARTVKVRKSLTLQGVKYPITKIEKGAFIRNLKIRKVVIGNNVEEIGNFAFFATEHVRQVTIGTGARDLGDHTFCHNYSLRKFVVRSKKLKKHRDVAILHGGIDHVVIRVPKKKVKAYRKNVFYTHKKYVKALKH